MSPHDACASRAHCSPRPSGHARTGSKLPPSQQRNTITGSWAFLPSPQIIRSRTPEIDPEGRRNSKDVQATHANVFCTGKNWGFPSSKKFFMVVQRRAFWIEGWSSNLLCHPKHAHTPTHTHTHTHAHTDLGFGALRTGIVMTVKVQAERNSYECRIGCSGRSSFEARLQLCKVKIKSI